METIELKNRTVIQGHCLESDGILWMYMYGITMPEAFEELIEPENIIEITENRQGQETTFTGYNHLFCIREETGGMVSAGLKKV